ncbi:MAG: cupredoxin domain-containing protein [Rhizomicrobium sp.]|nr:cupredoxin domain-containing protein [Rhizomicrobium sp.]
MKIALYTVLALALSVPALAQNTTITIKDFKFMVMDATVTPGSTVTWKNLDEEPHTVTSETGLFKSGGLDTDESFAFKFEKPGIYKYRCSIHPQMVGIITVK